MTSIEYVLTFILGVISSLVASHLYVKIGNMLSKNPRLEIDGIWGEYVPNSANRNYTIGQIYFDKKRAIYAFDGTNYTNEGRAYCHFETVASHSDLINKKYYYIFSANIVDDFSKTYFGFGTINLADNGKNALVPIDGYYLSASVDTKAMTHSMQRLEDTIYKRDREALQSIRKIKKY